MAARPPVAPQAKPAAQVVIFQPTIPKLTFVVDSATVVPSTFSQTMRAFEGQMDSNRNRLKGFFQNHSDEINGNGPHAEAFLLQADETTIDISMVPLFPGTSSNKKNKDHDVFMAVEIVKNKVEMVMQATPRPAGNKPPFDVFKVVGHFELLAGAPYKPQSTDRTVHNNVTEPKATLKLGAENVVSIQLVENQWQSINPRVLIGLGEVAGYKGPMLGNMFITQLGKVIDAEKASCPSGPSSMAAIPKPSGGK